MDLFHTGDLPQRITHLRGELPLDLSEFWIIFVSESDSGIFAKVRKDTCWDSTRCSTLTSFNVIWNLTPVSHTIFIFSVLTEHWRTFKAVRSIKQTERKVSKREVVLASFDITFKQVAYVILVFHQFIGLYNLFCKLAVQYFYPV